METLSLKSRLPVKSWLPQAHIEASAFQQIIDTANHPEAIDHVALMPDCHMGFGVTIGTIFKTVGSVIPNAVGVDIGCGMSALDTHQIYDPAVHDAAFWHRWAEYVRTSIPNGFSTHQEPVKGSDDLIVPLRAKGLQKGMEAKVPVQVGTLGGGNHFLESQVDEEGHIWLMVHSGSRGTGHAIATHYHHLAVLQSEKRGLRGNRDLSSLLLESQEGQDYLVDMEWAADFAQRSRAIMVDRMFWSLHTADPDGFKKRYVPVNLSEVIDITHNYAWLDEFAPEVLHRKGATPAETFRTGIIPGSMGTPSYIVRGKGNPDSFESCSHGAGRVMGRNQAKRTFSVDEFAAALEGTHSVADARNLDESPMAYKPIETVIGRQSDLVDIIHCLTPLMTVKGSGKAPE